MSLAGYSPWGSEESDRTEHNQNTTKKLYKKNTNALIFLNSHPQCSSGENKREFLLSSLCPLTLDRDLPARGRTLWKDAVYHPSTFFQSSFFLRSQKRLCLSYLVGLRKGRV